MIVTDGKKILPFYEDYKPVNVYRNNVKIAGWRVDEKSGTSLEWADTYNDKVVSAVVPGESTQVQTVQGKNLLDLMAEPFQIVSGSPGPQTDAGKAILVSNTIIVGLSRSGRFSPSVVLLGRDVSTGELSMTTGIGWYGVGIKAHVLPNTTYTTPKIGTATTGVGFYQADGTYIGDSTAATFTTPADCAFIFVCYARSSSGESVASGVQLELGSAATPLRTLHPQQPQPREPVARHQHRRSIRHRLNRHRQCRTIVPGSPWHGAPQPARRHTRRVGRGDGDGDTECGCEGV